MHICFLFLPVWRLLECDSRYDASRVDGWPRACPGISCALSVMGLVGSDSDELGMNEKLPLIPPQAVGYLAQYRVVDYEIAPCSAP